MNIVGVRGNLVITLFVILAYYCRERSDCRERSERPTLRCHSFSFSVSYPMVLVPHVYNSRRMGWGWGEQFFVTYLLPDG